jgi:peptide/nickel transport system ATP-binding protein
MHAERFPHEMSGGQRQRAMIAMALASQPELMIADEPTSALDAITQRRVLELISDVCARRHMTLIFISHDIRAVSMLCTRIAVMRAGVVVETGPTDALLRGPVADYTRRLLAASRIERTARPSAGKREVLLEADKVSRVFRQGAWPFRRSPPVVAVDQVSFGVGRGEVLALVGPSGCGKTTLARMIVGLDSASSGSFRLDGQSYRGRDLPPLLRAAVSLVFQDPFSSFDPRMTIGRSLAEPLGLIGQPSRADRDRKLDDAIRSVGLEPSMLERYPHEFSGGQRQRLAIARALITNPRLLVLDEPVSALDVSVRGEVLALLGRLREEHGLSYLVISHDLDMVAALADRVLVMDHGRIVEEGPPDTLFSQPHHAMTRALVDARLPEAV